jgi:dTDP-4-amino-4,6-dideoxygalactose transaminase
MTSLSIARRARSGSTRNATPLPYGRHLIEADDVRAVADLLRDDVANSLIDQAEMAAILSVLSADLLTQGPRVEAFEREFASAVGAPEAVACTSGTTALHLALHACDLQAGDVCIVPAITFLSTATAARFCGAEVEFADVDPVTGLMTPETLREAVERTGGRAKAVAPVHLAGRACDMPGIAAVARDAGLAVIEDACHALGTREGDERVGASHHAVATTFSFHPVKTIACGEGGMITTRSTAVADRLRRLRNHGVTRDPQLMTDRALSFDATGAPNPWSYEQLELGFNYRMTELAATLGRSQLAKLDRFVDRRLDLARRYDRLLAPIARELRPVPNPPGQRVSMHLYVVHLQTERLRRERAALIRHLIGRGVGCQVHYIPVYRQPYFVARYGPTVRPGAEQYYGGAMALPFFPAMDDTDVDRVVLELSKALMLVG